MEPVNMVISGSKKFCKIIGVIGHITGEGSNTPYIAFALVEQLFSLINNWNVGIVYSNKL